MSEVTQETPVTLERSDLTELATFASAFTPDRSDAAEVVKVAGTLAEWAKQAVSHDDLRGRMSAMRLSTLGEGTVEEFIERAKVYYEFMSTRQLSR